MPAFHYGQSFDYLSPSIVRDPEGDWKYLYVGRFVDRDMAMRFLGLGVGHIDVHAPKVDRLNISPTFSIPAVQSDDNLDDRSLGHAEQNVGNPEEISELGDDEFGEDPIEDDADEPFFGTDVGFEQRYIFPFVFFLFTSRAEGPDCLQTMSVDYGVSVLREAQDACTRTMLVSRSSAYGSTFADYLVNGTT